jgi:hypothetical protein
MVWMLSEHDAATIREIQRQRDRSAAIIAAACLEQSLTTTLKAAFESHPAIVNKMFKGYGPLATFAAQIDIGLLMGMYPEYIHKTMLTIKDIRNEFAHNTKPITFSMQRIHDLCNSFQPPRVRRTDIKVTREHMDQFMADKEDRHFYWKAFVATNYVGPDTPRNRYMIAVKECLFWLAPLREIIQLSRKNSDLHREAGDELGWYWPWPLLGRFSPPPPPPPRIGDRTHKKRPLRRRSLPA